MASYVNLYYLMWIHTTSCEFIPPHVNSYHLMWNHTTSCGIIPPHVNSYHLMWNHTTSCGIIPPHVNSYHLMWNHTTSCEFIPPHVESYHLMWNHITHMISACTQGAKIILSSAVNHAVNHWIRQTGDSLPIKSKRRSRRVTKFHWLTWYN